METVFALAAIVLPKPMVFRLLAGLAELLFLGWFFARRRRRHPTVLLTLFLLFNPVSLHEIWREGHLDHIAAYFLLWAALGLKGALARPAAHGRGWLFALLAISWKFYGILALAYHLPQAAGSRWHRLHRSLVSPFGIACITVFLLQFIPAWFFTPFAENGLKVYTNYWHHGNAFVTLFSHFGFADAHGIWIVQRLILAAGAGILLLYLARRISWVDAVGLGVGTLLVLFPVQHPWYWFLSWPMLMLWPRWQKPFMLMVTLAPLSYLGYDTRTHNAGYWVFLLVWLGMIWYRLRRRSPNHFT